MSGSLNPLSDLTANIFGQQPHDSKENEDVLEIDDPNSYAFDKEKQSQCEITVGSAL